MTRWTPVFEQKEVKEMEKFSGQNAEVWRRRTTNYFVSKVPDIRCLLELGRAADH